MKTERSDVEYPIWRKKVDTTILSDGCTPIPNWVMKVWGIEERFGAAISKKHPDASVGIFFNGEKYEGRVTNSKRSRTGLLYRLFLSQELIEELKIVYVMSYMRSIENGLRKGKNYKTNIEKDIPFWEFLDIEFNNSANIFYLNSYYTQELIFPELFKNLVNSTVLQQFEAKEEERIAQSQWHPRATFKDQFHAYNVIYYLIDTKNKCLYIGETEQLQKRFLNGHNIIPEWDYYRYDLLPKDFTKYQRVALERMLIRCFASFLDNTKGIAFKDISGCRLINIKIDK